MKLLHDLVMVKKITEEEKRASGLILPSTAKKYPLGIIKQVGIKVKALKEGEKIMFQQHHNGTPINFEGEDYLLLSESRDIIGTV